jgi:hypothetical protein
MNNENEQQNIKMTIGHLDNQVLCAIRDGKVCMRPRWQFILRAVFAIIGAIALVLSGVYLMSFIIFVSRSTGVGYAPLLSPRGWQVFFASLPWVLILLTIALVLGLEILLRRYAFAYRRPVIYSFFGLLVLIVGGSVIITATSFHHRIAQSSRVQRVVPFVHTFYSDFRDAQFGGVFRGVVQRVATDTLYFVNRSGTQYQVYITPGTLFLSGQLPAASNTIVIFGAPSGTAIEADGIGVLESD